MAANLSRGDEYLNESFMGRRMRQTVWKKEGACLDYTFPRKLNFLQKCIMAIVCGAIEDSDDQKKSEWLCLLFFFHHSVYG